MIDISSWPKKTKRVATTFRLPKVGSFLLLILVWHVSLFFTCLGACVDLAVPLGGSSASSLTKTRSPASHHPTFSSSSFSISPCISFSQSFVLFSLDSHFSHPHLLETRLLGSPDGARLQWQRASLDLKPLLFAFVQLQRVSWWVHRSWIACMVDCLNRHGLWCQYRWCCTKVSLAHSPCPGGAMAEMISEASRLSVASSSRPCSGDGTSSLIHQSQACQRQSDEMVLVDGHSATSGVLNMIFGVLADLFGDVLRFELCGRHITFLVFAS